MTRLRPLSVIGRDLSPPDPDGASVIEFGRIARLAASSAGRVPHSRPPATGRPIVEEARALQSQLGQGPQVGQAADDDARWLAATAQGDANAYRRLVERHLSVVVAVARGILKDAAEAEDMAQEAFLRLWRNAGALELGPGGVRPWLRRVVMNLCIDRVRASRNLTVTDEVPERAVAADQAHELERREVSVRMDRALADLPERQRTALVLFHYEGMSQIDIGRELGVSAEAVESLLSRGRRALKSVLQSEWRELLPDASGEGDQT